MELICLVERLDSANTIQTIMSYYKANIHKNEISIASKTYAFGSSKEMKTFIAKMIKECFYVQQVEKQYNNEEDSIFYTDDQDYESISEAYIQTVEPKEITDDDIDEFMQEIKPLLRNQDQERLEGNG